MCLALDALRENTSEAEEPVAVDHVIIFGRAAPSSFRAPSSVPLVHRTNYFGQHSTLCKLSIIYGVDGSVGRFPHAAHLVIIKLRN